MTDNPNLPPFEPDDTVSRITQVRQYIYQTISSLIDAGYNLTDVIHTYADIGVKIATKELGDIFSIFSGTYGDLFEISQVPPNLPIPPYVMETFNSVHDTEYRYIGEFVTYDKDTQERKEVRFFLDSDQILSRNMAANQMLEFFLEKYPGNENTAISSINIIQAYRNA